MIIIVAKCTVKPACKETFIQEARELVAASRKEAGNLEYHLHQDVNDANVLTFIEYWKDDAAIEKHGASAHFTSIFPRLQSYCAKEPELNYYYRITE